MSSPETNRDIEFNLKVKNNEIDETIDKAKKEAKKDPITVPITGDFSTIQGNIEKIAKGMEKLSAVFSGELKSINKESKNIKFESIEKSFLKITEYLSTISDKLKDVDFSKIGNIDLSGFDKLSEVLDRIGSQVDIISSKLMKNVRPENVIQSDITAVQNQIKDAEQNAKKLKRLQNALKRSGKEYGKLFRESGYDFVDNDSGFQKFLSNIKEYIQLGGKLSDIKLNYDFIDQSSGDISKAKDTLFKLLNDINKEAMSIDEIHIFDFDLSANKSKKSVKELTSELEILNRELETAKADAPAITVDIDQESIQGLADAIGSLKAVFGDSTDVTFGFKSEDVDKITTSFDELKEVIIDIKNLLENLPSLSGVISKDKINNGSIGEEVVNEITQDIKKNAKKAENGGEEIGKSIDNGIDEQASELINSGREIVTSVTKGISDNLESAAKAGQEIGETISDNIHVEVNKELENQYESIIKQQQKAYKLTKDYPSENVSHYENAMPTFEDLEKDGFVELIKEYYEPDKVDHILDNVKGSIQEMSLVQKEYNEATKADYFTNELTSRSFENQLKFFDAIAEGTKEGKNNLEQLQNEYAQLSFVLQDGTVKTVRHIMDLGDTFGLYKEIRGQIVSINNDFPDSRDSVEDELNYRIADVGKEIESTIEPIFNQIHDNLTKAFMLDDSVLSSYSRVLDKMEEDDGLFNYAGSEHIQALRDETQRQLDNVLSNKLNNTDAPQELINEYNRIFNSIGNGDAVLTVLQAVDQIQQKAEELGYTFDDTLNKWIKLSEGNSETSEIEDETDRETKKAETLAEKFEYLKKIKAESKFMETAEERLSDMEDKAWDVGGNNPKSEADSQKKIQKYEELEEHISRANAELDNFNETYEKCIVTLKNGEEIEIFEPSDLDDITLAKNKIQDIQFILNEIDNEPIGISSGRRAADKLDEIDLWSRNNVNRQLYPPVVDYIDTIEDIEKVISVIKEYKNQLEEIQKTDDGTISKNSNDEIIRTIGWLENLIETEDKILARKKEFQSQSDQDLGTEKIGRTAEESSEKVDKLNDVLREESNIVNKAGENQSEEAEKALREAMEVTQKAGMGGSSTELLDDLQKEFRETEDSGTTALQNISAEASRTEQILRQVYEELYGKYNEAGMMRNVNNNSPVSYKPEVVDAENVRIKDIDSSNLSDVVSVKESGLGQQEREALDNILSLVIAITKAVNEKTEAFGREALVVGQSAEYESDAFKPLLKILQDLAEAAEKIVIPAGEKLQWVNSLKNIDTEKIQSLGTGLKTMRDSITNLKVGNTNFITQLNDILSRGKELENFAKILSTSQNKINKAKENVKSEKEKKTEAAYDRELAIDKEILKLNHDINVAESTRSSKLDEIKTKNNARIEALKKERELLQYNRNNGELRQRNRDAIKATKEILAAEEKTYRDAAKKRDIEEREAAKKKAEAEAKAAEEARKKAEAVQKTKDADDVNKRATDEYRDILKTAKEYYGYLEREANNDITKTEINRLEELREKWKNARKAQSEYASDTSGNASNKSVDEYNKSKNAFDESNLKLAREYSREMANLSNKLKEFANSGKYTQELNNQMTKIANSIDEINDKPIDLADEEAFKDIARLKSEAESFFDETKTNGAKLASADTIAKLNVKIQDFISKNTKMGRKFREEFENLKIRFDSATTVEEIRRITAEFNNLRLKVDEAGKTGMSFFDKIKARAVDVSAKAIGQYFSFQDIIRYTRQIATEVINVDSALTELRKVSDASNSRLQQNFKKSAETAQELGSTITDVINITSDWARLGYNVDEAEELARVNTMFQKVGDNMDATSASQYLVSTLQGFQLSTDKAEEIADKYNEVANNFAIDTAGIGEALQRSAASFNAANTDLSKSIALITATNEVIQNPESVGTLWKTLSARIRGAKTELQDLGEEEDQFTETTSKLRDLVKSMTGFDIMKDKDTFKDIYEIILGIGEKWNDLTDIEQASLGEALAGKRNANALFAVLGNLDTLQEAYSKAENSAGSASKEMSNYSQSIQYSLDRVKASAEQLSVDFLDSSLLKGIVETGNSALQILDKLIGKANILVPLLSGLVGGGLAFKNRNEEGSRGNDPQMENATVLFNLHATGVVLRIA